MNDAQREEFDRLAEWLAGRTVLVQRLLWTGSRSWSKPLIRRVLELFPPDCVLVHGGAKGADKLADQVWNWLGRRTEVHLPRYGFLGDRAAPLRRDRRMVNLGADCCVATIRDFSRGATQTAAWAREAEIETFIFRD